MKYSLNEKEIVSHLADAAKYERYVAKVRAFLEALGLHEVKIESEEWTCELLVRGEILYDLVTNPEKGKEFITKLRKLQNKAFL